MLSTPPAFVLSQNQTLRYKNKKQTHDPITLKKTMNYWQNKKQSGHTTPGTPTHPMLCTPHECPNQQTPQQNFSELQDHTKHDLKKIKKHIRYQPRTPTPPLRGHQRTVTTSRFTNTHHHNTTHKHAVPKTYWTKHTLEFSNNTPHQQHHHTQTHMQRSSSAGQWYCHSILSDNLCNYTRFHQETQVKNFMPHITNIQNSFNFSWL